MGRVTAMNKIEHADTIIKIGSLQEEDKKLLEVIRKYLDDILENTYNYLLKEVYS